MTLAVIIEGTAVCGPAHSFHLSRWCITEARKTIILLTMVYYGTLILRFDGACKGRREGPSGSGWLIVDATTSSVIAEGYYYIGKQGTCNVAEYMGLLGGLKFIQNNGIQIGKKLHVQGDSELVIKHMKGEYVCAPRVSNRSGGTANVLSTSSISLWTSSTFTEKRTIRQTLWRTKLLILRAVLLIGSDDSTSMNRCFTRTTTNDY